jgi:hypothetical protein
MKIVLVRGQQDYGHSDRPPRKPVRCDQIKTTLPAEAVMAARQRGFSMGQQRMEHKIVRRNNNYCIAQLRIFEAIIRDRIWTPVYRPFRRVPRSS